MRGNLLNPRHSDQQSLGNKGPLCPGRTNVVSTQLQLKQLYVEKLPTAKKDQDVVEIFKRSNILKKKKEEVLSKKASFWEEIRKMRTRFSKWTSVPF
ncbi:hypothetical protein APTSU1_000685400 [Apodemus speciosus]|uniref:Uncharacterized protein n=1 Tax=Apodemus speciosus TaxID=105296 RepID=A0ABQ0EX53_APOSI